VLAFLILLIAFWSLTLPLVSIGLNLLSVGAACGLMVWIFQDGHLQGLLGFTSYGGVSQWVPLFTFVLLFGLSMDYHVFILSRIRERWLAGATTPEAVVTGIAGSAGVVTSAAVIMVAVFSIFATLSFIDVKMLGVGLAFAVLIDATLVRGILVPAAMVLLGEGCWFLPRRLSWLPSLSESTSGSAPVPVAAATVAAVRAAVIRAAAVQAAAVRAAATREAVLRTTAVRAVAGRAVAIRAAAALALPPTPALAPAANQPAALPRAAEALRAAVAASPTTSPRTVPSLTAPSATAATGPSTTVPSTTGEAAQNGKPRTLIPAG
jgi:MMPL family protein